MNIAPQNMHPTAGSHAQGSPRPAPRRPRVVIIGAGFGGLSAARALRKAPVDITIVDRRNYHLFQPLLYQVATAGLSPAQIASPIRRIFRQQRNVSVRMEKVIGIDRLQRHVITEHGRIAYDTLIVATGARHNYFGNDQWEGAAPGLKKIDDATYIRRRILLAFERAEAETDPVAIGRLLTFVVIGGGPTGVELAGAISELARKALASDFRHIDPSSARVVLIEAAPRLLASFPEELAQSAARQLAKLGVEVRAGAAVTDCSDRFVTLKSGEMLPTATIVWAAGVMASPAARWLGAQSDRQGRVNVDRYLNFADDPAIFVIGDTASCNDTAGRAVPGVAPAAKQMGQHVAASIIADLSGRQRPAPFRYRDYGNLATIGRKAAIADFGWLRLAGFPAWLLWSLIHVYFLIGHRNRLAVLLDWAWAYVTYERGVRLITGATATNAED